MRKFDGVLLVSDFDDTFYTDRGTVPQANLDALDYFIGEGGRFTVATGRAHRTFAPYVYLSPVNAPVILSNGSAIYDFQREKMLQQTFLPDSAPRDFSQTCAKFPALGFEAYHGEDIYLHNPNAVTEGHMKKVGSAYTQCSILEMPTPWTKAIFEQDYPLLLEVQAWFLARYGAAYEAIFSNQYLLEITAKGSQKGSMVLHLAQLLDISREHIYCVGDNQNDIPMLAVSAIPFAPSNCAQVVRDWGAQVLCHCEEGVIAPIVEQLDKRY